MDVSALSALTSAGDAALAREDAAASVLRKSLDAEQDMALRLIQSIPQMPGLGENVDLLA